MSATAAAVAALNGYSAILGRLHSRLTGARLKEALAFAEGFLKGMSIEDLCDRDDKTWADLILDLLDFMRTRPAAKAKVRVFNPTEPENGWESSHTVIQIVNDDMPFLVDSVGMVVAAHGAVAHALIHPVYGVTRDPSGHLLGIGVGQAIESVIHIEIDRQTEVMQLRQLKELIEQALMDVRAAVVDWHAGRRARSRRGVFAYQCQRACRSAGFLALGIR